MRRYPPPKGQTWRGQQNAGSTRAWREQRARILERDGYQCTAIEHGQRCPVTAPLEVHHLHPGYGPIAHDQELATVCPRHNPRGG